MFKSKEEKRAEKFAEEARRLFDDNQRILNIMNEHNLAIARVMDKNKHILGFKSSLAYAEAYVDGAMELNNQSYMKGYQDAINFDSKYPHTISIMGKDIKEIFDIISKHEEKEAEVLLTAKEIKAMLDRGDYIPNVYSKEKTMTRDEAIAKLSKVQDYEGNSLLFIKGLEALGLIKFDEPKREYIFFPHPDAGKDNVSVYQDDAVKTLKEYGYSLWDKKGNLL